VKKDSEKIEYRIEGRIRGGLESACKADKPDIIMTTSMEAKKFSPEYENEPAYPNSH